jgi:Uma2 family endonuclease
MEPRVSLDDRNAVPMQVDAFLSFTETRPPREKWELIDGEPILNASPSFGHQRIVRNLVVQLGRSETDADLPWQVLPGLGVRLSDTRVPEPDVLIRPGDVIAGNLCADMLVAFEILSPSTRERDLQWKRDAYAALPSLLHYAVIAQDRVEVTAFDRATGWRPRVLTGLDTTLDLPALAVSLPLAELYRGTALAPR